MNDILKKYNFKPYKYGYINKACIIYTDTGKYVIKNNIKDKDKLYDYLLSRDFNAFLYPENDPKEEQEIFKYLEEVDIEKAEKAKDLILIASELHNRTTSYKELDLDEIKEIYEKKLDRINYLIEYYNDLEESIMRNVYFAPEEYLLLRNITKVYNALNYSKILVEKWYENVVNNKKIRVSLIHNRLSLDHFIDNRDAKLINFNHAKMDSPIYDIAYFFKMHYMDVSMDVLYDIYKHRFKFTKTEELLFFIEIIIPEKVIFNKSHLENTSNVYKFIRYIDVTRDFILKEQKKNKNGNKDNKPQENNSI